MAHQHDNQDNSGGFWGLATIILGIGFAAFALFSSTVLIIGGIRISMGIQSPPAPASTAPTAAAAAPATAGDALVVTLKPGLANPMSYDTTSITAKSGQKVKLTFANQHPTAPLQHNFVLCKPGTKDTIIAAANAMMAEMPKWLAKGFIPESPEVLHHTKLLNAGESETLEFTAGPTGDYPYLCTFPGHSMIMQGTLKVQ